KKSSRTTVAKLRSLQLACRFVERSRRRLVESPISLEEGLTMKIASTRSLAAVAVCYLLSHPLSAQPAEPAPPPQTVPAPPEPAATPATVVPAAPPEVPAAQPVASESSVPVAPSSAAPPSAAPAAAPAPETSAPAPAPVATEVAPAEPEVVVP